MIWARLRRGLVADIAGYVFGRGAGLVIVAIGGVIVARYLGPADFGLLGFAKSIYALMTPVALLGMRTVLVREFSTSGDWQTTLASALRRQLPAALVVSTVGFLIIAVSRDWEQAATLVAFVLLPVPILATADTLEALHEAVGHVRLVVGMYVGTTFAAAILKVIAVLAAAPVWVFAALTTLEAVLVFIGLAVGARRKLGPLKARVAYNADRARAIVRESWPLLIASIAVIFYMRVDVAMLGLLAGDDATGVYVAAATISEIWYFLPVAGMAALRPRLARYYARGEMGRYDMETQQFMSAAWGVSLSVVILTIVLSGAVILLLYGDAFAGAESVLQIHILAAPFVFLGEAASQWFIDRGLTRTVMVRSVVGAVVNVALNLVLIPAYGAQGAAVATLVSYALASVFLNAVWPQTRPVFRMQSRALLFARR